MLTCTITAKPNSPFHKKHFRALIIFNQTNYPSITVFWRLFTLSLICFEFLFSIYIGRNYSLLIVWSVSIEKLPFRPCLLVTLYSFTSKFCSLHSQDILGESTLPWFLDTFLLDKLPFHFNILDPLYYINSMFWGICSQDIPGKLLYIDCLIRFNLTNRPFSSVFQNLHVQVILAFLKKLSLILVLWFMHLLDQHL